MNYRRFHVGEEARVGTAAYDRRLIGAVCTIRSVMKPIGGEHRYAISTASGIYGIVLESTLRKMFDRGRWSDCVWQPRRVR